MWWHGPSVAPLSPVYLVLLFWYWIQTGSLDIVTHLDSHSNTKFLAKDSFKCSTIISICNLYHSQQAGFCSSLKVQLLPKFQVPSAKYSPVKININHFKNPFYISFHFFLSFHVTNHVFSPHPSFPNPPCSSLVLPFLLFQLLVLRNVSVAWLSVVWHPLSGFMFCSSNKTNWHSGFLQSTANWKIQFHPACLLKDELFVKCFSRIRA